MREICFDTETTGLEPNNGDRIIEVGLVELMNYLPTGRELHLYINPDRLVSEDTVRITGLTNGMLMDKPFFSAVVGQIMDFIGESPLVAHNAEFDRGFLNAELDRCGRPTLPKSRFIDTLVLAREHRPGAPASLDAVCKRFGISLEGRELHGAIKDARLLSMAYLELRGGRERAFDFAAQERGDRARLREVRPPRPSPLPSRITPDEAAAHAAFLATLGDNAVWKKYDAAPDPTPSEG